ncbi:uncharacterized protein LOC122860493 [Aphidius gifuensis]|uniref:uncharacterized protein LOC122860493 n=1 Tax=Aphidius gifuensis TaxID=684658 RepID=UPI001CDD296E|nr:uncharacterized protein LOC122860493 [Aphidius gifuensis]
MNDLDDFYRKIQIYLMKKDSECGKLRYLSSRTTNDNCDNIDDVCDTITSIFESCKIPKNDDTSIIDNSCIQAFKYLILNTNFQCQDHLMEDFVNGHLVDMCPPISCYLLMEIIYALGYDMILAESILYYPFDLTNELFEIIHRCIGLLDFNRAFKFLIKIINNSVKKIIHMINHGIQTTNMDYNYDTFILNIKKLIELLNNDKFTKIEELIEEPKSERYGIILKNILELIIDGFVDKNNTTIINNIENIYRVSFGREIKFHKLDENKAMISFDNIQNQLFYGLFKCFKNIDFNIYLDWADLEYNGSSDVSYQQAIGYDCHELIDLIDKNNITEQNHLLQCLQQFSMKKNTTNLYNGMSIKELCDGIDDGNKSCMKELLKRNDEWNHDVFFMIKKNYLLIDKDDFVVLLDYMTRLMIKPGQEEYKQLVFNTIKKSVLTQSLTDMYDITLNYILQHNGNNILESNETEESFKKFIQHNVNIKSSNNLRIILFYMIKNPNKILNELLNICFGINEYNIMISPNDLSLLSPIMKIRDNKNGSSIILTVLKNMNHHNQQWESKKYMLFIKTMIDKNIFTIDELINHVYIHWLDNNHVLSISCLKIILNNIRQIVNLCTINVKFEELIKVFAKILGYYRNHVDNKLKKSMSNEIVTMIIRIIELLLNERDDFLTSHEIRETIMYIEPSLKPIDKYYFMKNWITYFDVTEIVQDYHRKIQSVLIEISAVDDVDSLNIDDDILMHVMINCTELEYIRIGWEYLIIHWDYFKFNDEHEAYDKYINATIKCCLYYLQFHGDNNSFCFMIKCLARFAKGIHQIDTNLHDDILIDIIIDNFKLLNRCIVDDSYEKIYNETMSVIDNCLVESVDDRYLKIIKSIDEFGDRCAEIILENKQQCNDYYKQYNNTQKFISHCIDNPQSSVALRLYHHLLCQKI